MSFINKLESKVKQNYNIWDLAMTKWTGILFGLLVGAYFPGFIKNNILILSIILSLIALRLIYKLLKK